MEVHHHPGLHHRSKSWKEYFLEFLMIFLALTMGFFAESFREYLSGKEKEKAYVRGFARDLRVDSAFLVSMVSFIDNETKNLDSLMFFISAGKCQEQPTVFYQLALESRRVYYFQYVNTTFEQVKGLGAFGLIGDTILVADLIQYDNAIHDVVAKQEDRWLKANSNQTAIQWKLLDATVYTPVDTINSSSYGHLFSRRPEIANSDKPGLLSFYNLLFEKRLIFPGYLSMIHGLQALNKTMLQLIEQTYHPGN